MQTSAQMQIDALAPISSGHECLYTMSFSVHNYFIQKWNEIMHVPLVLNFWPLFTIKHLVVLPTLVVPLLFPAENMYYHYACSHLKVLSLCMYYLNVYISQKVACPNSIVVMPMMTGRRVVHIKMSLSQRFF